MEILKNTPVGELNEKTQMDQMSVKVVINKVITISEEDVIVEFYTDKENKLGILLTKKIKKDNLIISKKVKKEIDIKDGEYSFIFTKNGNKIKNEVMLIASSEDTKDTKDVLIKIEKMEKIIYNTIDLVNYPRLKAGACKVC